MIGRFAVGLIVLLSACSSSSSANSDDMLHYAGVVSECYVIGEYRNFLFRSKPRQPFVSDETYSKQLTKGTRYWENYIHLLPENLREDRLNFYRNKYPVTNLINEEITTASIACSNGKFWKVWPSANLHFDDPPDKTKAVETVIDALTALDTLNLGTE